MRHTPEKGCHRRGIVLPPERLGARIVPIRPFLANQAFVPELIQQMSLALETVCAKLELGLTDDPATRLVASKIIELAQRGCAGRSNPERNDASRVQALLIHISQ
jgi:hypothetical protein